MGFQETPQIEVDGGVVELPGEIQFRSPLKPVLIARNSSSTCSISRGGNGGKGDEYYYSCQPTTPTSAESRVPARLPCPLAPRKRKASSLWSINGSRELFNPPDLETVFIRRHVERPTHVVVQDVKRFRAADLDHFSSPNN